MLLDEVRVDAFARAIAAVVRPGDVVLDIGTGTGVLAILAARAGARRVFAVDRTGIADLARRHVEDNRAGDVVEVIRADLTELDALPEPPRVVIGEQLGHFAPGEHQHRLYASARRLVAADAVLMPSRYRLVAGAAEARGVQADLARLAEQGGVRFTALVEALRARPGFWRGEPDEMLGAEVGGPWNAVDGPPPRQHAAALPIARDGRLGGITLAFTAELAPGIELSTGVGSPRTCWGQTLFPVDPPLPVRAGDQVRVELWFRIVTNPSTWAWRVELGGEVREADGFAAAPGDRRDLLAQLGARARPRGPIAVSAGLRAWAAALGVVLGEVVELDDLAARARAAMPARYANLEEARQDVLALVWAAEEI
jgi:precorrin-6B methylase 2